MEETALYRPILKKAWQITTRLKSLWFLGLFAAILSSGGEFELLTRIIFNRDTSQSTTKGIIDNFMLGIQNSLQTGESFWSNAWSSLITNPVAMITTLLVLIVVMAITLFIIWLAIVSQVGLINNVSLVDKKKKFTINGGIDAGVEKFWPVLSVNIIYKIILFIIFMLLGKELITFVTLGTAGTIIHIISLVLFSIITVIVSFIIRYQIMFIVLKKERVMPAMKSAWNLFVKNWLVSLEMAVLMFIVYAIAVYLTAFITSVLLAIPVVFITYTTQIPVWFVMIIGLTSVLAIFIITFIITAMLSVFQWSSWTLLFNKISGNSAISRITRLSEQSPNITVPFSKK